MSFLNINKSVFQALVVLLLVGLIPAMAEDAKVESPAEKPAPKTESVTDKKDNKIEVAAEVEKKEEKAEVDIDDELAVEAADAEQAAVALPVSSDPVQVYGWREKVLIDGSKSSMTAKLDTGAYTSSIHAEEKQLFERDGKKWVRFVLTEPQKKGAKRVSLEAPLVRIARIKNPGEESETREVVKLSFKIGDRKLRGDFTLNNRSNMLAPILIGRTVIKELGWIDPTRTNIADDKVLR